jgi:methyl-accepting chemotaxis protein
MKLAFLDRWFGGTLIADQLAGATRLITWVFGLLAAVILTVGTLGAVNRSLLNQQAEHGLQLKAVQLDLLQLRRHEKDFVERRTPVEIEKHAVAARVFNDRLETLLASSATTGEERESAQAVQRHAKAYIAAFNQAAKLAPPPADTQSPAPASAEFSAALDAARKSAHAAEEAVPLLLASGEARRAAGARRGLFLLIGLAIVSTLVLVVGGVLVMRSMRGLRNTSSTIASNVAALQSAVNRVREGEELKAGDGVQSEDEIGAVWRTVHGLLTERRAGQMAAEAENEKMNNSVISILQAVNQLSQRDLTAKAPVTQDMIGTVSDSINALTDETAKVLRSVTEIATQVAQASGNVRTQAELVSRTAEDERGSVGRMVQSLAEATKTMARVSDLAQQSNTSAEEATRATHTALETVTGTVRGMDSIRETIAETEKRIKRLGERSQEISGIVNLINTISERTHVLALNASMQAAVAGEAGRGFAVVAEEVQRLAESSRNATQQIATLVNNIQLETNETISTVNRTIGQVVDGSELAQRAGEQMRRTQEITAQLVAQVARIGEASTEQKANSAQLLQDVQHIGDSTERTGQQIVAQNRETETLLQSAHRLLESVNVFKLPQAA